MSGYPRDLVGYADDPPHARWPGGARIAVQFVINYEEGGENSILHGDEASEAFLSEIHGAQPWPGRRHRNMESMFEYGSRAGFWRLRRIFMERGATATVFGVATALARNPKVVEGMTSAGWEIACHGLKWIDYRDVAKDDERDHIAQAISIHEKTTGERPEGFYQGRTSDNTVALAIEAGCFLYCADSYSDDLPYWLDEPEGQQLVVPYSLDANDMRFSSQGFAHGEDFHQYLKDSFDVLYEEGAQRPKILSIGLHCRLAGRPGRARALERFLDYVRSRPDVWIARRVDIARHWIKTHPPDGGFKPSRMGRALFVEAFGDIFEHTPEIAERAHAAGLDARCDTAAGLREKLVGIMRAMPNEAKRALIAAHPDLAGKLALAKGLTEDSTREQAGAGLSSLTPEELARFTSLNDAYRAKFGFPFIIAVKSMDKPGILAAFARRVENSREAEFEEALRQIERIAALRLESRLPS